MKEKKKKLILSFLVLFIAVQCWAVWTYQNIWPFSSLTMFAKSNSTVTKVRTLVAKEDGTSTTIPPNWLSPFGRFRAMMILRAQILAYKDSQDPDADFILTDIAGRAEALCLKNKIPTAVKVNKVIYQFCEKCSAQDQNQNWETVKEVDIDC